MEFIITSSDIKKNPGANSLFERFREIATARKGYCYFKYPIAGGLESHLPDIVLIDLEYGVAAFDIYSYLSIDKIESINDESWRINGEEKDSLLLKLEDYVVNLKSKYEKYRQLREKVKINYYVVFPQIKEKDFLKKFMEFGAYDIIDRFKFSNFLELPYESYWKEKSFFENTDYIRLFLSVSQGAGRLNDFKRLLKGDKGSTIGEAIKLIDTRISYLDKQQHAAAIQIPDGPQRIRGMAGTGKTIILTMKAAFLHSRYPNAKILYTFNTQSLYNQVRDLITKFYRDTEEKDPNWNNLLIMHSWGGKSKEGVYSRACLRNSIETIPLMQAQSYNSDNPFGYVCREILKNKINEEYDFVLMDEAQDFPPSFYQLIYKLTIDPKRIIFAYDELQSLNKLSISDTGDLFGYYHNGIKIVDFSKGSYESGIEMDYVLYKSYRNPLKVLMTAHSIGLGLYNQDGFMQVIEDKEVWKAIGYDVIEGELKKEGEEIVIERPKENSISFANELYSGTQSCLLYKSFTDRTEEITWIGQQIENDIKNEGVEPHDIMVISINQKLIQKFFIPLQNFLFSKGIPSIIPGIGGIERDKFGEKGFVTLSTVYKAKGNEAFIVYVMAFDYLYDYSEFVLARNRAFTSISRSKGWCRITGVGKDMERAITEIETTLSNIPKFIFKFPDQQKITKKLSREEHARRLQEEKKSSKALQDLLSVEDGAINLTEEEKEKIRNKLGL